MNKRSWAVAAAATFGVVALAWLAGTSLAADKPKSAPAKSSKKDPARAVFGLTRVHKLHLSLTAREWAKMQPPPPRFPWMPAPAKEKEKDKADTHKGGG